MCVCTALLKQVYSKVTLAILRERVKLRFVPFIEVFVNFSPKKAVAAEV